MTSSSRRAHPRRASTVAAAALAAVTTALTIGSTGPAATAAPAAPSVSAAPAATGTATSATAPLTVRTPYGRVQGKVVKGKQNARAQAFLGLPFAQAPVYDLAWKAPVKPKKWKGTRDATAQAPACLQYEPTGVKNSQPTSADCLYLDVYRPADVKPGEKLPVMVFYHGGAGTQGTGVIYGGQTMASRDHVIVVSTNYRLGAAGSLALPSLDAENPSTGGNFALLDQVEALKWVHKSIKSFGGDPKNVTIEGQSAGSRAVCNLLATPLTSGLIDQAIMESSPCLGGGTTKQAAETSSEKYAAAIGCPATSGNQLACLRGAWPAKLVQQFATNRPSAYVGAPALPQASGDAIAAGNWHKVPVLMGNNRWEQKLQMEQYANIDAAGYADLVYAQFGQAGGDQVLAKYPASAYAKPFYALAAVKTDSMNACQMDTNAKLFAAQGVPVYRYEFEDPTSPTLFGFQPPDTDMSSAHSGELAYLFDFTLGDRPLTKKELKLSRTMQDYWTAFATSGKPRVKGATKWGRFDSGDKALRLSPTTSKITGTSLYVEHNCAFFAQLPKA